jgi:hypothetical protein
MGGVQLRRDHSVALDCILQKREYRVDLCKHLREFFALPSALPSGCRYDTQALH